MGTKKEISQEMVRDFVRAQADLDRRIEVITDDEIFRLASTWHLELEEAERIWNEVV